MTTSVIRATAGVRMLQNNRNMVIHFNVAENTVFYLLSIERRYSGSDCLVLLVG